MTSPKVMQADHEVMIHFEINEIQFFVAFQTQSLGPDNLTTLRHSLSGLT